MLLKNKLSRYGLVFFISFAALIGSGYNTYLAYERFYNPDTETYTNIARCNFKDQSLIRKYRVIVPFMANMAAYPLRNVYYKIVTDQRDKYDWPLLTGFFLINALLMSLAAVVIYRIMQLQHISEMGCVIGLAAFLTGGRWASFIAAHPVTDSLTILSIAVIVYGLIKPHNLLLAFGIIIGLLSKESTALFFPFVLLFVKPKGRLLAISSMALAFLSYFSIKYFIDQASGSPSQASINEGLDTFNSIKDSLVKLFSVKGMADVFSVYGFFNLLLLSGIFYKQFRRALWPYLDKLFRVFLLVIFVHMLLSTELARMFYLGSALFAPLLAKCFDIHPLFKRFSVQRLEN